MKLDELLKQITSLPYMLDDGLLRQQDLIDQLTLDLPNPDRHWTALGIEDSEGYAESVAYVHPNNAAYLAHAANVLPDLVTALDHTIRALQFNGRNPVHRQTIEFAQAALAKATEVPS